MEDCTKMKEEVYKIIINNNRCVETNEQYCFACGVALTALLFAKEYGDGITTSIYEDLLEANDLKEFSLKVNTLIEQNLDYIEQLPQYKSNLFKYITDYTPSEINNPKECKEYFVTGTTNSIFYFEANPVPVTDYATMHGVSPSTIRYHIYKKNLKTPKKIGRFLFISEDEPYPKKSRK